MGQDNFSAVNRAMEFAGVCCCCLAERWYQLRNTTAKEGECSCKRGVGCCSFGGVDTTIPLNHSGGEWGDSLEQASLLESLGGKCPLHHRHHHQYPVAKKTRTVCGEETSLRRRRSTPEEVKLERRELSCSALSPPHRKGTASTVSTPPPAAAAFGALSQSHTIFPVSVCVSSSFSAYRMFYCVSVSRIPSPHVCCLLPLLARRCPESGEKEQERPVLLCNVIREGPES